MENAVPTKIKDLYIRFSDVLDGKPLYNWLLDPTVGRWFPMFDELEIEDAVNRWISFAHYKCSLTAMKEGKPVGLATLYLQPYKKLAHQCEFGIIVAPEMRGQGVGTELLKHLFHLAKTNFKMNLIHLQVYQDNPAIRLYERLGFAEFGRQTHWIQEAEGEYRARVFMEKFL